MPNMSIYLPEAEAEWVNRNVDNLSRYVKLNIIRDMDNEERVNEVIKVNKRLSFLQMISFLFLGLTLLASSFSIYFNAGVPINHMMIGLSGIFALIYVALGLKKNGGKKNGFNPTDVIS